MFEVGKAYNIGAGEFTVNRIEGDRMTVTYPGGMQNELSVKLSKARVAERERKRRRAEMVEVANGINVEMLQKLATDGRDWTVEEALDLLETAGHPLDPGKTKAYAAHGEKWGRSRTAPRYMYERLNPAYYANSREHSR